MFPIKKVFFFAIFIIGILFVFSIYRGGDFSQQSPQNERNEITHQAETKEHTVEVIEPKQSKKERLIINPFGLNKDPNPLTVMLFGVDKTKDEKYGRSDSIMLALIKPKTKELLLMSIPRDTYIHIPNYGFNKLNSAFQLGGPELSKETIERWLNIEITDTVCIDYANFEKLVDLIGGIEIYVDRRMVHSDFTLEEGLQTLSGKEALGYVRFRKSVDGRHDSDYKRTERQRQVLSTILDELLQTRSFSDSFVLLRSLLNTVDTTLSMQQILTYGHHYSDFSSENITTSSFKGEGIRRGGLWYEYISDAELEEKKQLIKQFIETDEIVNESS